MAKRNRSRDAYSGVFPEVGVDMGVEDIASRAIDEEGTRTSLLKNASQCPPDGAERREGRTVLVCRKRLQRRSRKESNDQEIKVQNHMVPPASRPTMG